MKSNFLMIFVVFIFVGAAMSCSTTSGGPRINTDSKGFAAHGYDAVAFFADNAAVRGNPTYEYAWNGAKWAFATAANLEQFKQEPTAFAPQFGGYCAYSASQGKLVEGNPEHYKVVDGKLYFCNNAEAARAWEQDDDALLRKAERFWAENKVK